MVELARADATASRAFFVRMLTRDISVEDCILDLIDNSVDSAWKSLGKKKLGLTSGPNFSKCSIAVDFDDDSFSISDNCGGMSLESAKKYAFTFGRKDHDPEDAAEFSIGVYGIGLKRAIFKLGTKIDIESTYSSEGKRSAFLVPINVKTWVKGKSNDWDFPIEQANALPECGLKISVEGLTDLAKATFEDTEFAERLKAIIARDYALHFNRGLRVTINGVAVKGEIFKLYQGAGFEPLYQAYDEKVGQEKVNVEIVAGVAFPPPEDNDPTDRAVREQKSGWYVACNGRIVMAADKSNLSVWGVDDFNSWHPQYTGFFGLIMFTADDTELLPLTTTKRSVDLSSIVYRRARPRMSEPTRTWIDYTNHRKNEREVADTAERQASLGSIFALKPHTQVHLPVLRRTKRLDSSVQFRMLTVRVKTLARELGDPRMSNSEVGRQAFEYAYENLVDDE